MDNESITFPRISRIIGIVLVFGAVFITSLWLGHRLGNTTRRAVLSILPLARERATASKIELKHAKHSFLQPKAKVGQDSAASQPVFNRQRNILLIGIDSFQSEEPCLEGVWMILYLRDLPHIMLMPVYPNRLQGDGNSTVVDQNLAHLFKLEGGQIPGALFLQALKDKKLWWDGYVLLDRSALSEILALTSTGDEATHHNGGLSASNLPDVEEEPQRALMGQVQFAQELCRNASLVLATDGNRLPSLIAKASSHIKTDLNMEEIAGEIKSALRYSGGISCEFPSLTTAANLP